MLQKDQISEELPPYDVSLPPHLSTNRITSVDLPDYEFQFELEDSAYHSYKVENKLLMIDIDSREEQRNSSFS